MDEGTTKDRLIFRFSFVGTWITSLSCLVLTYSKTRLNTTPVPSKVRLFLSSHFEYLRRYTGPDTRVTKTDVTQDPKSQSTTQFVTIDIIIYDVDLGTEGTWWVVTVRVGCPTSEYLFQIRLCKTTTLSSYYKTNNKKSVTCQSVLVSSPLGPSLP